MTPEFFKQQWDRLKVRFGDRAMDDEFGRLALAEVRDMSEDAFKRAVDVWIGSRPHNKPPLLSEFREARLAREKRKLEHEASGAAQTLRKAPEEMKQHMRKILSQEYGGVDSVTDAFEIARIRRLSSGDGEPA
ncbi:MAG: hypothetical protein AB7G93_09670 [Bdellovibrionales bacterium]